MAITRSSSWIEGALDACRSLFSQKRDAVRVTLARWKVYRTTHFELMALTDRDLADLGIPRSSIRRLARETAYGR